MTEPGRRREEDRLPLICSVSIEFRVLDRRPESSGCVGEDVIRPILDRPLPHPSFLVGLVGEASDPPGEEPPEQDRHDELDRHDADDEHEGNVDDDGGSDAADGSGVDEPDCDNILEASGEGFLFGAGEPHGEIFAVERPVLVLQLIE